ncbi:hypothetical protein GCM10028822_07410 [Hymenobacter terrigena]
MVLSLSGAALAQSRPTYPYKTVTYIGSDNHVLPGPEGAHHWLEYVYRDSLSGTIRQYSAAGKLQESTPYADMAHLIKLGPKTTFYDNGNVRSKEDFVAAKRNGEFVVYYPEGQVKRRETYVADVRQTGECFAEDGSTVPFYEYTRMPSYKGGGTDKMTRAIAANVRYPDEALRNQIQGRVFVAFEVGLNGEVANAKVVKGLGYGLDEAALNAVKKLTGFVPGQLDGVPVAVSFTLPVIFSISQAPASRQSVAPSRGFPASSGPY